MNVSFGKSILFFLLIFAFSTGYAADKQEKTENVETINQDMSLIEIFTLTNTLPEKLIDLRNQIDDLTDTTSISKQIPNLSTRLGDLEWETTMAASNTNLSFHQISALNAKLAKLSVRINRLNKMLINPTGANL